LCCSLSLCSATSYVRHVLCDIVLVFIVVLLHVAAILQVFVTEYVTSGGERVSFNVKTAGVALSKFVQRLKLNQIKMQV